MFACYSDTAVILTVLGTTAGCEELTLNRAWPLWLVDPVEDIFVACFTCWTWQGALSVTLGSSLGHTGIYPVYNTKGIKLSFPIAPVDRCCLGTLLSLVPIGQVMGHVFGWMLGLGLPCLYSHIWLLVLTHLVCYVRQSVLAMLDGPATTYVRWDTRDGLVRLCYGSIGRSIETSHQCRVNWSSAGMYWK